MRQRIPVFSLLLILTFLLSHGLTSAALDLSVKEQFIYKSIDSYIDTTTVPVFKMMVKAMIDTRQAILKPENLIIRENNRAATPFDVSKPDIDGWQTVRWYTKASGANGWSNATVIVFFRNEVAQKTIQYYLYSLSKVRMTDTAFIDMPDFHFGNAGPGDQKKITINVNAISARIKGDRELPVQVDSVKIHTPYYSMNWRGALIDHTPPPVGIISPFDYKVDVTFQPNDNNYHADKLTVYYEGGRKEEVNLTGNKFEIPRKTILNLIQPNGGEVLTPCQQYLIKWVGAVKDLPTKIEYSNNDGASWKTIEVVTDSTYLWTVPKDAADSVLVRVSQPFKNTTTQGLRGSAAPVRKIAYRSDADRLLSFSEEGKIFEWNLKDYTLANTYSLGVDYPGEKAVPFGLEYIDGDRKFVAGYYKNVLFAGRDANKLAFFNTGTSEPYLVVPIDSSFQAKKMAMDSKKSLLAVMPDMAMQLFIYSTTDGSLVKTLDFPCPVTSVSFSTNEDKAVVALLNGEVDILSVPDFTTIKTMNFSDIPIIVQTSISPNGQLISIGCMAPQTSVNISNKNEIHVVDINTSQIVRTVRNTASDPVGLEFNPSSNVLVIGSQALPQISMWDLPSEDYIGAMSGSEGMLTDFKVSPEGHSIAVSSATGDNLTVRTFTYPESDESDGKLRIVNPVLTIKDIKAGDEYISTANEKEYTAQFCNTGIVPLNIENSWMQGNINFHLKEPLNPDTLMPGECKTIKLTYTPLDTGLLADTIIVTSCSETYRIPVGGYSIPRHISLYQNVFDFGQLCMGETMEMEVKLARNDDPVPLKINFVEFNDQMNSPFAVVGFPKDTILPPGGSVSVKLQFKPNQLGDVLRMLVIHHSDLNKYMPEAMVKGFGIGAILESSHSDLRFIPDIASRKIKLTNKSNETIKVEKATFIPDGSYKIVTQLPLTLAPGEEGEIEIAWNGTDTNDVSVLLEATPCAAHNSIVLGIYRGTSKVSVPVVEADPRGNATIPVSFENTENRPYKGTRFFETEISVNPRMFLPQSVTSSYGEASLIRNEIVGDKRVIGIRVEGDFAPKGVAAEIYGVAGLAETDSSPIEFNTKSAFWGKTVQTTTNDGTFKLINVCGDKFIVQNDKKITIQSVSPNPASEYVNIEFEVKEEGASTIEIYDEMGSKVAEAITIDTKPGIHNIPVDVTGISTGTYKLVVRQGANLDAVAVVVVR